MNTVPSALISYTTIDDALLAAEEVSARLREIVQEIRGASSLERLSILRARILDYSFPGSDRLHPSEIAALRHVERHLSCETPCSPQQGDVDVVMKTPG